MDDDDFNSEFLGSLQRHANLKQNQKTQQEIAGLREDLRRKEAAEAAAPKCPYCAGAISYDVIKCRHCTSDVQWCEVEGNAYVLKAEDNAQLFIQQKTHEFAEKLAEQKRRRADVVNRLAHLPKCIKCGAPVNVQFYKTKGKQCVGCYESSPMGRINATLNFVALRIVIGAVIIGFFAAVYYILDLTTIVGGAVIIGFFAAAYYILAD